MHWRKGLPARLKVMQFAFQVVALSFVITTAMQIYTAWFSFSLCSGAFFFLFSFFLGRKVWPWEPISRPKFAYSTCSIETWWEQHWRQMAAVLSASSSLPFPLLARPFFPPGCWGQLFIARSMKVGTCSCCSWWCWLAPSLAFEGSVTDLIVRKDLGQ